MEEKKKSVQLDYKDTVFCALYRDSKERRLELYNSVSGKNYKNAEDLQVVTLKHAIYMGMKNDLAEPYFVVFYNGADQYSERKILKLSDLYKRREYRRLNTGKEKGTDESSGRVHCGRYSGRFSEKK